MNFVAGWSDDDVVLALGCAGEQLGHGVLELGKGLARAEAALLAVDIRMRQIEAGRSDAGERIEHFQGFGNLLHHVVTFWGLVSFLVRGSGKITTWFETCKRRIEENY